MYQRTMTMGALPAASPVERGGRVASSAPQSKSRAPNGALLEVTDLKTYLYTQGGKRIVKVVDGVSFALRQGETLAIIGESGCGKSMLCSSIMQVLPKSARITQGEVLFKGENLLKRSPEEMERLRGSEIGMILQDPLAALDPLFTIGSQMAEPVKKHRRISAKAIRELLVNLLRKVQLSSPETRVDQYPHELSGGMLQRVVGATAISCSPALLIADEPTTALDPTVQAQFLDVLDEMKAASNLAVIVVTHDLGVAARISDRIMVMYAGRVVESGPMRQVLKAPAHPYTRALLESIPVGARRGERLKTIEGQPPDLADLPPGCSFAARCPNVMPRCATDDPPDFLIAPEQISRCWLGEAA